MLKLLILLAGILCLLFSAGTASANTLSLLEYSVENGLSVDIYVPGIGSSISTTAGNYMIQYESDPTHLVSGFCIDPHYSTSSYSPYIVEDIPQGSAYAAAAWILSQNYSAALAPAAQIAVWELTWDYQYGNGFNLSDGNFRLNSPTDATLITDITNIYNDALAAIQAGFDASGYVIVHSPVTSGGADYQDYVVPASSYAHAPIPPSVLLLGSGLLGLGLLRFRRTKPRRGAKP